MPHVSSRAAARAAAPIVCGALAAAVITALSGPDGSPGTATSTPVLKAVHGQYNGDGVASVGTIRIRRESTLDWSSERPGLFAIANAPDDEQQIALQSTTTAGRTVLAPGVYRDVTVYARGRWSFTIRAR